MLHLSLPHLSNSLLNDSLLLRHLTQIILLVFRVLATASFLTHSALQTTTFSHYLHVADFAPLLIYDVQVLPAADLDSIPFVLACFRSAVSSDFALGLLSQALTFYSETFLLPLGVSFLLSLQPLFGL